MPRKYGGCFSRQCVHEDDEDDVDDDDDGDGYHRLQYSAQTETCLAEKYGAGDNSDDENNYFKPVNSYQGNSSGDGRRSQKRAPYAEVDIKGKRLSKKLRRKELRHRIGHALHSTWKWLKRGFLAMAPNMASMFMVIPSLGGAAASAVAREQAAREAKQKAVFL